MTEQLDNINVNIPRNMVQIWIGPLNPPLKWMKTWQEKHQNWTYRIFDNAELERTTFINQHLINEYMRKKKYEGVADLIRYEILYNEGGFMPEADSICLENTEELFIEDKDTCYTVYENENLRPGLVSPIYACNPGNKFVETIIKRLNTLSPKDLKSPWKSTGNLFLKHLIEERSPRIKIFPSHYFIPEHFDSEERYTGPDKVYAEQMWGTTKSLY